MGYGEFKSLREIAVPQGNPAEWVTEVGCGTRMEPARRYPKILSKSGPGRSLVSPECVRDPSGTHPSDRNAKKRLAEPKRRRSYFFKGQFWDDFGTRPGPQNRLKTGPEPKKCVRRRRRKRFLAFFRAVAVRSRSRNRFLKGPTLKMWPDHHTELDFQEIGFFEKTPKIDPPGTHFGSRISENRRRRGQKPRKSRKKVVF